METWTIGEVAARSGVPTSTIRYYEQIELLPAAKRANGRRRYDAAILPKLNIIRLAQQKLAELDERMQTIQAMKAVLEQTLDCQCGTLEECGASMDGMC